MRRTEARLRIGIVQAAMAYLQERKLKPLLLTGQFYGLLRKT